MMNTRQTCVAISKKIACLFTLICATCVMTRRSSCGADRCTQVPVREATVSEIQACHTPDLVRAVARLSNIAAGRGGRTRAALLLHAGAAALS